jgi:hypothetical protein
VLALLSPMLKNLKYIDEVEVIVTVVDLLVEFREETPCVTVLFCAPVLVNHISTTLPDV